MTREEDLAGSYQANTYDFDVIDELDLPEVPSVHRPVRSRNECPACTGQEWETFTFECLAANYGDPVIDYSQLVRNEHVPLVDRPWLEPGDQRRKDSWWPSRSVVDVCVGCGAAVQGWEYEFLPPRHNPKHRLYGDLIAKKKAGRQLYTTP